MTYALYLHMYAFGLVWHRKPDPSKLNHLMKGNIIAFMQCCISFIPLNKTNTHTEPPQNWENEHLVTGVVPSFIIITYGGG